MVANPQRSRMAPAEYLAWAQLQECRYEYVDGQVFAVGAESAAHSQIINNVYAALQANLAEGCQVYSEHQRLQISPTGPFYYPDIFVTCDRRGHSQSQTFGYPNVIAEVISSATENRDRGLKFAHYRRLESLREFILIQSDQIGVECFRKNEQGTWFYQPYEAGSTLILESIEFRCLIDLFYQT